LYNTNKFANKEKIILPIIYNIQNSIIGIILISIILFYLLSHGGRRQAQDSIFISLLFVTLTIIIFEFGIDVLEGKTFEGSRALITIVTFIFYVLNPIPGALYLLYLDQLRRKWIKIPNDIGIVVLTPLIITFVLNVISLFNGIIFVIDENNIYQRGNLFFIIVIADFICMIIGFFYMLIYNKDFKGRDFSFFILFPIPVFIGAILQAKFYGVELTGISLAITLLIVFIHTQNSQANKDFLTMLYNRNMSEKYLENILSREKKGLACILMDVNSFKQINDNYGHDLGDTTLRYFAHLLEEGFKASWFIARYGGDEFILFREGTNQNNLEKDIAFFNTTLDKFNSKDLLPFTLSVSIGSAMYENTNAKDGTEFIKAVDNLMYEDKRSHHLKNKT